jgi:hypothetical protein
MKQTVFSAPDPFRIDPLTTLGPEDQNFDGLTLANPATVAASSPAVVMMLGGSMISNSIDGLYTPTNATHIFMMAVQNGGLYRCVDPVRGTLYVGKTANGSVGTALIDALVTAGYCTDAVLMHLGWNSSKAADWATGGQLHSRIAAGIRRLQDAGLAPTHIIYQGGSNDAAAGTTATAYKASMADIIATCRAEGAACPFFINQQTWDNGSTNSTIRTAQSDSVTGTNVYLGFDSDTLDNTYRQADHTHFNASTGRGAWVTGMLPFIQAH